MRDERRDERYKIDMRLDETVNEMRYEIVGIRRDKR